MPNSTASIVCMTDVLQIRKILVSVKFLSAILGPEMGAPILWTPGKCVRSAEKAHVHKIPRFWGGGGYFGFWGEGGECRFYFYWRADFSEQNHLDHISATCSMFALAGPCLSQTPPLTTHTPLIKGVEVHPLN